MPVQHLFAESNWLVHGVEAVIVHLIPARKH